MKKTCISLCLIVFAVLQAYAASSWKETRTVVFTPAGSEKTHLLQPDQSISETVTFGQSEIPTRKFLRVIGGVKMPAPFQNRGEEMFRRSEFYIDDNLDSVIRKKDRYSLYFKGEDDNFERHAYYRISGKLLKPGELTVTLPVVKKQGLTVSGNGDFGVEIELFYRKPGRAADDIYDKPDNYNYWIGCNLSTRSWPMWKLEFNGETLFEGNIFDRASNVADFYIPLPSSLHGSGEMKLTLRKEPHHAAYPYELRGLEIIEETARDFEVVSVPEYVAKNASFGILVETNRPNVSLKVKANGAATPAEQECLFEIPGLHVVEMRAGEAGHAIPLVFDDGSRTEQAQIRQVIDKEAEQIYLSSGDEIYIDKQYTPYDYFFKWYVSNRIGNWYQFRPSYQWSGFRVADPAVIGHYTRLLDQLKIPYAWQVEGRTLAGSRINPSLETLATPMFRGKQAHENDGGYYYWQHFQYQGVFSDMAARNRPYGGIFAKHRPIYTDHGVFIHYDPEGVTDMADGARKLVANFRYSKGPSTRHTGPSTLFRYLYQAGYDWLGAEQPSALRDASCHAMGLRAVY